MVGERGAVVCLPEVHPNVDGGSKWGGERVEGDLGDVLGDRRVGVAEVESEGLLYAGGGGGGSGGRGGEGRRAPAAGGEAEGEEEENEDDGGTDADTEEHPEPKAEDGRLLRQLGVDKSSYSAAAPKRHPFLLLLLLFAFTKQ